MTVKPDTGSKIPQSAFVASIYSSHLVMSARLPPHPSNRPVNSTKQRAVWDSDLLGLRIAYIRNSHLIVTKAVQSTCINYRPVNWMPKHQYYK